MSKRDELAAVVRGVTKVGPFGPNALEILGRGGKVHLTGTEADALADAVLAWLGWVLDPLLTAADIVLAEADEEDREDPNLDELAYCAKAVVAWLGFSDAAQDAQDGTVGPGSVRMGTGEGAGSNGAQIEDFEGER